MLVMEVIVGLQDRDALRLDANPAPFLRLGKLQ
jgi:hypothetical protein